MGIECLTDLHTHTDFSPDAKSSPEKMCERAQQLGLTAYAVTDHCDCNLWEEAETLFEDVSAVKGVEMYGSGKYSQASIERISTLKNELSGRLNLLCGIELGQPLQNLQVAEKIISKQELDFVIGSHHQNSGMDDFYFFEYNKMDLSEIYSLLDKGFEETLEMCKWGKFDVLGHLTYPLRYVCGDYGIEIDLSRYGDVIREIFCTLIQNGKGIEINTSGLRQKYGKTFPDLEYVRLYRELGGEIVTLGSDAHSAQDLGKGIAVGAEIAKSAGFKRIAYFEKRKPKFIELK